MARAAFALVVLGLLVVAIPGPVAAPSGGLFGGELRVALQAAPSLDPDAFEANRIVQELVFDSLTRLGKDYTPTPWLADTWTPDAPNHRITLHVRSGATWPSDGAAVTAQDVAWSFGKHLTSGAASGFTVTSSGSDVTFTFVTGGGDFLGNAATLPVAWRNNANTAEWNGPFLVEAQSASAVDLVANEDHWNGRPYVDRLSFRFPYTLDRNADGTTRANDAGCALMFRQVHLIGWRVKDLDLTTERDCVATFGGWPDDVATPETNESLRTLVNPVPGKTVPHSAASDNPDVRLLYLGINNERLTDAVIRQALTLATDRDQVVGTYGNAIEPGTDIADSLVSPMNLWWFNASVPKYRVPRTIVGANAVPTLEGVNAFLDQAGYLLNDEGLRENSTGETFDFTLLHYNGTVDARNAKYYDMETKFRAIGLNATRMELGPAALRAQVQTGSFDLFVDILEVGQEPSFLFDLLHRDGNANVVRVQSLELDALLETVRDAINPAVRRQAVRDVQGWVGVNVPLAPIVHLRALNVYDRQSFEGWAHLLGGIVNFWSFLSVHAVQRGPLLLRVSALVPSVESGETARIRVEVRDSVDDPVEGVDLELTGDGLADLNGTTDAAGIFETDLVAPSVTAARDFVVTVNATKPGYVGAQGSTAVSVHPKAGTLLVTLSRGHATMRSGNTTTVTVIVLDASDASPVLNATVALAASPSGLDAAFGAASGRTDASGTFQTTFTADVPVLTRFLITATVSQAGYEDRASTTSVEVTPIPTAQPVPGLDVISIVAVVAILAAVFGARQRRRWRERAP